MPDHWMFEGTGMNKDDTIPGLVGWEFHADPPTPEEVPGLTVVGKAVLVPLAGGPGGGPGGLGGAGGPRN